MSAQNHKPDDPNADIPTTGHDWDGIKEYDNPMPRWWLWTFYLTIIWGIGYTIAYPAWPLFGGGATPGVLGYSSRGDLAQEMARVDAMNAETRDKILQADLTKIGDDPALANYASRGGAAIFRTYCEQCHGAGAEGVQRLGYPNLLDDDWLWGGDIQSIYQTVSHGIRDTNYPDARFSEMPKFGADGLLDAEQIGDVVEYVLELSGQDYDATKAKLGAVVYADNCAACHGSEGQGDRSQGAPNLSDAVWLYGGDRDDIRKSVYGARFGVMPGWSQRLSEADLRAVSFYIHSLGGGE